MNSRAALIVGALATVLTYVATVGAADLVDLEESAVRAAVDRVAPSVVRIQTVGGASRVGRVSLGSGPASGLVVSADGYIISSGFNFVNEPTTILIELADGTSYPAKLVARDGSRSLVLLKIELPDGAAPLAVPEAVPDDEVLVGAWSIALGRTFDVKQPNVSVGIISAVNRIWGKAVQTDAKVSPNNYGGPLIDIRGRVFGVLAPLSPQSTQAVAGARWYDSGIGFAVPLSHVFKVLEKLKQGQDLEPGVIGISFKSKDQFGSLPIVAAVQYGSPAQQAGMKGGDTIVEINGQAVKSQAQLKHVVSPLYAGDVIRLAVTRAGQRFEFEIELTDKLPPYAHPFLGILPRRDEEEKDGIVVRYVYPNSGADAAGIKTGDRLTKLGDKKLGERADLSEALLASAPDQEIDVVLTREGKEIELKAKLGTLTEDVPAALPAARAKDTEVEPAEGVGAIEIKIPEFENECFAYVPESYDASADYGVVVWLHRPGQFNSAELVRRWKSRCEENDLILLAPRAREPDRWQRDEIEFVNRVLEKVRQDYQVDDLRTVAHGYETGGAMAMLVGMSPQVNVHGVAAVEAAMPSSIKPAALGPTTRAAFYWAYGEKSPDKSRIAAQIKQIKDLNYPVTERQLDGSGRYLYDTELDELVRWIDSLDRI